MKRWILLLLPVLCIKPALNAQPASGDVDIVFCLDLSSSTNGLIDRFRDHLWDYTWLLAKTTPQPRYRIGIVGFSRPSFKRETGYVKVLCDLTYDLESLSKIVFDLKSSIEKGDQFVGHALEACLKNISWSEKPDAVKVLFLAGNGMVNLGGTDFRKLAAELAEKGVILNTLYCNTLTVNYKEIRGWQEIAQIGNGKFDNFFIRTNYSTPLGDFNVKELWNLNVGLNRSYLYYGALGKERWRLINDQDRHIYLSNPEGFIFRSAFKVSPLYQGRNSSWDLVDLYQAHGVINYSELDPKLLPDSLKHKSEKEITRLILEKKIERLHLVKQVKEMIAEKERKDADANLSKEKTMQTFDILTMKVLREILEKKGYVCSPEK